MIITLNLFYQMNASCNSIFLQFALPDNNYVPTRFSKCLLGFNITGNIPLNLLHPIVRIRFGGSIVFATLMRMPKATMNKYCRFMFGKDNIRLSWQLTIMQSVSKASAMQILPYDHFWNCVLRAYFGHHLTPLLCCQGIHHSRGLHADH